MKDTDFLKGEEIIAILEKNPRGLSKSRLSMLSGVYGNRIIRLMKELVETGKVVEIKNHYSKNTWVIYKLKEEVRG